MYRRAVTELLGVAREIKEIKSRVTHDGFKGKMVMDADPSEGEGRWVTLAGGTKVFIDGKGTVEKGPKELTGGPVPKKGEPWRGKKTSSKTRAPQRSIQEGMKIGRREDGKELFEISITPKGESKPKNVYVYAKNQNEASNEMISNGYYGELHSVLPHSSNLLAAKERNWAKRYETGAGKSERKAKADLSTRIQILNAIETQNSKIYDIEKKLEDPNVSAGEKNNLRREMAAEKARIAVLELEEERLLRKENNKNNMQGSDGKIENSLKQDAVKSIKERIGLAKEYYKKNAEPFDEEHYKKPMSEFDRKTIQAIEGMSDDDIGPFVEITKKTDEYIKNGDKTGLMWHEMDLRKRRSELIKGGTKEEQEAKFHLYSTAVSRAASAWRGMGEEPSKPKREYSPQEIEEEQQKQLREMESGIFTKWKW